MDASVQVDINQPDVVSMTSSGSSAASFGDSTRRSRLHDRMSSLFFFFFFFSSTSVWLTCTKVSVDRINQI